MLNEAAFAKFLHWLGGGRTSEGDAYLEMRHRLVAYFDRRNCLNPDELADETLNRVARRLEEEGSIVSETPAKYCYTVARFVFLESLRSADSTHVLLETDAIPTVSKNIDERIAKERMLDCLEKCCGELDSESRNLIIRYYYGEERVKINNRRELAESLGVSVNALSIRACRIRRRLETCVRKCAG